MKLVGIDIYILYKGNNIIGLKRQFAILLHESVNKEEEKLLFSLRFGNDVHVNCLFNECNN